ncbi:hypothetical protein [Streptomyces bauhiniae]|uniref:hypothetical protein n=1 Tax=Streptomyces bauhiniae TaxID=2340725 RepID=UPI003452D396
MPKGYVLWFVAQDASSLRYYIPSSGCRLSETEWDCGSRRIGRYTDRGKSTNMILALVDANGMRWLDDYAASKHPEGSENLGQGVTVLKSIKVTRTK